ncbi:hypothetical protein ACIGXM_01550 [Kitasatospora sp. NPDC052896]
MRELAAAVLAVLGMAVSSLSGWWGAAPAQQGRGGGWSAAQVIAWAA